MLTYLMYVARYRDLFVETKNPLYALRAFHNAVRFNRPIPEEALDYIADAAHEIIRVAQHPPEPAQRPIALAKALKLHKKGRGQGSAFSEFSTRLQNREIALKTAKRVDYYGPDKCDYAFSDISKECGWSKSKVRRNFLTHMERWRTMAQKLIESDALSYGPDGKPRMTKIGTADDLREAAVILDEIERINKG
jgi:hypothetical protein